MSERTPCQDLPDPDRMFGNALQQRRARHICAPCPIRLTCLADALTSGVTTGLWGGMTHSERKALLRHHPDVHDWHTALTSRTPALAGKELRT